MVARNKLQSAPPYPVEQDLRRLGENLRNARIRRNLTIENVAKKIGTGPRAVMDAEKGKPSTGIVVYAALLWLFDLLPQLQQLADPSTDKEGLALEAAKGRKRVRRLMRKIGFRRSVRRPGRELHPAHKTFPYLLRKLVIEAQPRLVRRRDLYPDARGFLYPVAAMDWATREVLGWRLSNTMEVDFCVAL